MAIFSDILRISRSVGVNQIIRFGLYSLFRDWQDRKVSQYRRRSDRNPVLTPGHLLGTEATLSGARFRFERANLQIDLLASDLARISWEPGKPPIPYAIANSDWGRVQFTTEEWANGWILKTDLLNIQVKDDGGIQYYDANDNLLRSEMPPSRKEEADDIAWSSLVRMRPEECIYGLGEQAGPFNLRGTTHRMWNSDPKGRYGPRTDPIYMPIPVYVSLHQLGCYLVFYENSFPAVFDFGEHASNQIENCQISFEGGMLRYYFIAGSLSDALRRFSQLTGRPDLPPRWSLGYHQSRWGYRNETDIRSVVSGFSQNAMPLSAIHLDIDYMKGYRAFTVDPNRFPDLPELVKDLQERGIKLVTILDPGVKRDAGYRLFVEGKEEGRFCPLPGGKLSTGVVWPGWSVLPDFTDPKTRTWWGAQYRELVEAGVAGFWHDMNEPTSLALWGDLSFPLTTQHRMESLGADHIQAHNLYALLMNRSGYEALHKLRAESRPWILSRSGWASQQRYAWSWTGDTASSWEALKMSLSTVLGLGLSGLPYSGTDIGGFSGNPSAELFLRWFQMATFFPFFRTHSALTTERREPWVFGEPYTSIIREYLRLRYRLMPYLYSLAWQSSQTGHPLVRPLFWLDPADQNLWNVDDAFLLGNNLLIAPVFRPKERKRNITLPTGRWYSWWDDADYEGPGDVELPVTLEHIPILARSGSLLPLEEDGSLFLHISPPQPGVQPGVQILYSDHGDGYRSSRLDRFHIHPIDNGLEILWQGEGEFPFLYNKIYVVLHSARMKRTYIDDKQVQAINNRLETNIFSRILIEW
jgi:alpha-glucosidase